MVLQHTKPMAVEDFDEFIRLPENADKSFEFIGGEIVEVVSNNLSSETGATLLIAIGGYVKSNKLGRVTGADGGYMVSGERYIPDVAFISFEKQPKPSREAYYPIPPDLAVEVLSPTNEASEMRIKVVNYLRAGTTAWVVDPDKNRIEVYTPNQAPKTLGIDDTLEGGDVLPGFKMAVKDVFPE